MRNLIHTAAATGALLLGSACGTGDGTGPDATGSAPLGKTRSAVQGGKAAMTESFAVGVYGRGLCSGTLIAPNLVITARHCVEEKPVSMQSGCEDGKVLQANALRVTTSPAFGQEGPWRQSVRVLTGPKIDGCSPDVALVQIGENIPASEASPARPAVDKEFATRAHFSAKVTAIGYGLDDQGEAGQRRIRENISVLCVPGDSEFDCGSQVDGFVRDFEFVAAEGACQGDSGGGLYDQPSMDKNAPVVVGVVSRGPVENGKCGPGAYVRVDKFVDFVIDAAKVAAKEGGYPLPAWAGGDVEPPAEEPVETPAAEGEPTAAPPAAPPSTTTTTTSGCAAAPSSDASRGRGTAPLLAVGIALVAIRGRRQRR